MSSENIYQKVISEDFTFFKDLQERVPQEVYMLLAEHLVGIFSKQEKLVALIAWTIRNEVEATKHYSSLFREDSLGKSIVNRVLFGTVGINYLKSLISPIIKKLSEHSKPLEISPLKVNEKEAKENVTILLEGVDAFVKTFAASELACPLFIRKLLMHLQLNVDKHFAAEVQSVPFGLHFFFFSYVCVAMVSCDRYGIVNPNEMTDSLRVGLLNTSKLLKDLAGQTTKEGDSTVVLQYHKDNGDVLSKCFASLIDPKSIEAAKKILDANISFKFKPEDIESEKERFLEFLDINMTVLTNGTFAVTETHKESDGIMKDLQSSHKYQEMEEKLIKKLNDPNWKQKKTRSGVVLSVLRDKTHSSVSIKADMSVPGSIQEFAEFYIPRLWSAKYDSAVSDSSTIYTNGNFRQVHIDLKMPFPMTNRDCTFNEWAIHGRDRTIVIIDDNKTLPSKKGKVRAEVLLGGHEFTPEISADGTLKTRVRSVIHGDPKGSVPKWLVNSLALDQADKLLLIKKDWENQCNLGEHSDDKSSISSKGSRKGKKPVKTNFSSSSIRSDTDSVSSRSSLDS